MLKGCSTKKKDKQISVCGILHNITSSPTLVPDPKLEKDFFFESHPPGCQIPSLWVGVWPEM